MTVHDVERAITNAVALVHELEKRYVVALKGLSEAQRGISAPPDGGPSGAPGSRPPSGALIRPDEASMDLRAVETYAGQLVAASRGLFDRLTPYARLGLPYNDPLRAPTKEERQSAEGESIDDDKLCKSCIRIGAEALRHPGLTLCQWCHGVVREYSPMWPQMTMPPVEVVRLHHESVMGRHRISQQEMVRRLTICFGTPRKVTA